MDIDSEREEKDESPYDGDDQSDMELWDDPHADDEDEMEDLDLEDEDDSPEDDLSEDDLSEYDANPHLYGPDE